MNKDKKDKYLIFDTETTGLVKNWKAPISDVDNWPRLVQLAWSVYDNSGNLITSKNFIIKPDGFTIPNEAAKVHGITNKIANEKGVSIKFVLNEFSKEITESNFLVAHNIDFDCIVLEAEFFREHLDNKLPSISKICTMKQSTDYLKIPGNYGNYKWPTLSELYMKLFNKSFKETHRAEKDVEACAKCFFELKRKGVFK